jgi:amino acid adenylation domain-containing protein
MLAVMKAGAAYVMLDTQQPIERLRRISEHAGLRLVLSDCEHIDVCDTHFGAPTLCLDDSAVQERLTNGSNDNPNVQLPSEAPALVYVTSGSTGTPKGAINSHTGVINTMWAMSQELNLTVSDRVLQFASLSFDVVIEEVFPAWFSGAAVVLRDEEGLLGPEQLQAMLARLQISVCELMASYWSLWVRYLEDKQTRPAECLRTVILGSDAVLMPAYNAWQVFDIPIVNVFGLTETGCTTLVYTAQGPQDYETRLPNGRPLANTKVYILDAAGNPAPEGVVGELCIGGMGVGLGYVGEPELTAERFIQNPFAEGRLYKTGDLARWLAGGQVEFIGRRDHQVKLRGFRIELGEIEAQLQNQAVIRDAVVVFDDTSGEGRLVAYVVASDGLKLDNESLHQALSFSLPEYMVPAIYIELEALPLTSSGKVDRKALPKPDNEHLTHTKYEEPQGETEVALTEIWQSLLTVERVSRHDNFFRLGGHSLLIIRLIAELQARDLTTDVRTVFEHPVLKDLANEIGESNQPCFQAPANLIPADCTDLTPELLPLVALEQWQIDGLVEQIPGGAANIQDIYPLGPLQEGFLFHHLRGSPELGDTYIMPIPLSLPNRQQADRFLQALNQVVARHDVLRTAIFWDDLPRPVQVVLRDSPIVANELTLDPSQDALTQLREHMAPGKLWMDLGQAPLLRMDMATDPQSDQVFVILYEHHIINDHIGLEILIEEVETYLAVEESEAQSLPDLPAVVPYREFIAHSLMLAESDVTQAYFESKLGNMDEPTVPFGIYDTQVGAARINEFNYTFDDALCRSMCHMCSRLDISVASVFHLAWGLVIGRCSGRDDVIFGSVLSGRLQGSQGAARSVGLFINTLPIRLSLNGRIEDALKQMQFELLNLLEHEQASLALVRDFTALSNDAPLFTSLLNYRRAESLQKLGSNVVKGITGIEGYERSNYPLSLNVDAVDGEQFSQNLQVIEDFDGERLIGYVYTAVESLVKVVVDNAALGSTASLKDLTILSETEHQHLLVE